MFGIDNRAVDVGKNLELVGHAQVVSVTRHAVGNYSRSHLLLRVRINHVLLLRHARNRSEVASVLPSSTTTISKSLMWAERKSVNNSKVLVMQPSSFRAGMTRDNFTSGTSLREQ